MTDIDKGPFEVPNVKPGTYQLIIESKPPYKSTGKEGVPLTAGNLQMQEKLN